MAQYVELNLDQGTDFNFDVTLTDDDGSPINVAGYLFTCTMKKSYTTKANSAVFTYSVPSNDYASGIINFSLTAANTANIKAGRYVFDVKQKDTSNVISRVVEGLVTVFPQVTK